VWISGWPQTDGPADYAAVRKIQDGFGLIPLSRRGGQVPPVTAIIDAAVDMVTPPLDQVNMSAEEFFNCGLALMKRHPPHLTGWSLNAPMRRPGLVAGARFADLDPAVRAVLQDAPAAGLLQLQEASPRLTKVVSDWQMNIDTMDVYSNVYQTGHRRDGRPRRELARRRRLSDPDGRRRRPSAHRLARPAFREGRTPAGARVLVGDHVLRPGLPGRQRPEPLGARRPRPAASQPHRFTRPLPAARLTGSWPGGRLAARARGPLGVTMRLYCPQAPVLHGTWTPPPVRRALPRPGRHAQSRILA
jgi:hypothetical protein